MSVRVFVLRLFISAFIASIFVELLTVCSKPHNSPCSVMADLYSRRPLLNEAHIAFDASPLGIYGVQSDTGTGFFPNSFVYPVNIIPPVLYSIFYLSTTDYVTLAIDSVVK